MLRPTIRPSLQGAVALALSIGISLGISACHRGYHESVDRWYHAASAPSRVEPETADEREVLAKLSSVGDAGGELPLAEATVSVEPTYASAAQRACRGFVVRRTDAVASRRRVACRDGDSWFLVPDMLEDGSSDGPEDAL